MILWVKKDAVSAACNQRVRVDRVDGQKIHVTLEGTGQPAIVMPDEVIGLEVDESLTLMFGVAGYKIQGRGAQTWVTPS